MTRDEMVAAIHRHLGFRSDQTANILLELPLALRRLEYAPTKPWFLLSSDEALATVADTATVALPSDFIEEYEEDGLSIYSPDDEEWIALVKNDLDVLRKLFGSTAGFPSGYAIVGSSIHLYPIPDDAYDLRLSYYGNDTALSAGGDTNGFLTHFPEFLIGTIGIRIAQTLRDKDALVAFREMTAEARIEMYRQNESKKHANATYQMGGAH